MSKRYIRCSVLGRRCIQFIIKLPSAHRSPRRVLRHRTWPPGPRNARSGRRVDDTTRHYWAMAKLVKGSAVPRQELMPLPRRVERHLPDRRLGALFSPIRGVTARASVPREQTGRECRRPEGSELRWINIPAEKGDQSKIALPEG
ncbi:hypothetical protein CALCODRAFT_359496 [Calocera cornea HHB12733]|uniref:Uncharacterized protein n=1 Tax=Calocera cornea HHB12733 TaxID=1353952 RepID=A0A165ELW4_9BASI|nr:hypothetical protein CALCODRAFT_359496 [Calocera cornea HHB12733]